MDELCGTRGSARCIAVAALLLLALEACRSAAPPPPAAPVPSAVPLTDSSYDWHGLLIAPFGSVLKDVPVKLHEVLLFHDQARSATPDEDAECYGTDTTAPRFVGRTPDEYVLCFKRDRLARVQATVRLAAADAADVFAVACAGWLKNATTSGADKPDAIAGDATPGSTAPQAPTCDGMQGAIRFSGRLQRPGSEAPQDEVPLTLTLDSVASP